MNKNKLFRTMISAWGLNKTLQVGLLSAAAFMFTAGVCAIAIPNDNVKEIKE